MRFRVQSLALLGGLRIRRCLSCGVGCRHGSDPNLLWLWCRPVATALIGPLAWEPPYATGAALKGQKTKKEERKKERNPISLFYFFVFLPFSWATLVAYGGSQARGPIGAVATSLHQSHSNAGSEPSEPRLQPTPQLTATPDR